MARRAGSGRGASRAGSIVREFLAGASLVFRGFATWRRRPGLMLFGMLPAVIAAAIIVALFVIMGLSAEQFATTLTGFAESWDAGWRDALRAVVAILLVAGVIIAAVYTFTALTLLIGDPFYERVWRRTEEDLGGFTPTPLTFWRSFGGGILLVLRAISYGLLTFLAGLLPVVGAVTGPVTGVLLGGHLIQRELTTRPLEARGIDGAARARLIRGSRARALGFGVATQLLYLVPGGAIVVMPAAVVGATLLARDALARAELASAPPTDADLPAEPAP
ncbi:MAG: EI24 domain-containing protein [Actinobacteria bacterium]|nr:EI24 domain-containing protein [Actinomycetota bacterium]MBU1608873.1 EI24 domain-containing protein [Actinomycetota bacterium]MBU2314536.1 EI24 domain-containing protein [Actinomycetota bacterium]MBU2384269.1 EI24 domain-containing protein [Actinomycetota bacterium]